MKNRIKKSMALLLAVIMLITTAPLAGFDGLFVSKVDLETDLANSPLKNTLLTHYNKRAVNTLIKAMQTKKAENMMHFLSQNHNSLSCLSGDNIVLPLNDLKSKVEERIHPTND